MMVLGEGSRWKPIEWNLEWLEDGRVERYEKIRGDLDLFLMSEIGHRSCLYRPRSILVYSRPSYFQSRVIKNAKNSYISYGNIRQNIGQNLGFLLCFYQSDFGTFLPIWLWRWPQMEKWVSGNIVNGGCLAMCWISKLVIRSALRRYGQNMVLGEPLRWFPIGWNLQWL